jgi:hypothetical protein
MQQVVNAASGGQTRIVTLSKAIWLRAYLNAGRIRLFADIAEWVDLMPHYPYVTEEERMRIEPSLRQMFAAVYGGLDHNAEDTAPGVRWAASFWRQNWSLYACMPPEQAVPNRAREDGIAPSRSINRVDGSTGRVGG